MVCPKCGRSDAIHSSRFRGMDRLISFFQIVPYRCWNCYARFYRLRQNSSSLIVDQIIQYEAKLIPATAGAADDRRQPRPEF